MEDAAVSLLRSSRANHKEKQVGARQAPFCPLESVILVMILVLFAYQEIWTKPVSLNKGTGVKEIEGDRNTQSNRT